MGVSVFNELCDIFFLWILVFFVVREGFKWDVVKGVQNFSFVFERFFELLFRDYLFQDRKEENSGYFCFSFLFYLVGFYDVK